MPRIALFFAHSGVSEAAYATLLSDSFDADTVFGDRSIHIANVHARSNATATRILTSASAHITQTLPPNSTQRCGTIWGWYAPPNARGRRLFNEWRATPHTIEHARCAMHTRYTLHMSEQLAPQLETLAAALASAKRADDDLLAADRMLYQCLRRLGMCRVDVSDWLHE